MLFELFTVRKVGTVLFKFLFVFTGELPVGDVIYTNLPSVRAEWSLSAGL